jgi:hypothetical protein
MTKQESRAKPGQRLGALGWVRAQPGFRTAVIAFVLTVVLGIGGTAAYAYWSQSAAIAITATTRSDLPANTTLVGAQPAFQARPGTPTGYTCKPLLDYEKMRPNNYADIRFSWGGAAGATSYVITVKGKNGTFTYDQSQTVATAAADFRFGRIADQNGKPGTGPSLFYTKYTVRVMPMAGAVPGDPLYFTYEYEHYNTSNCYWSEPTGASPVGSVAPLVCSTPVTVGGAAGYSDLKMSWTGASGATGYSVTMVNGDRSYGGELLSTGTSASFRIMRPQPESGEAPYFATYSVRVQPMNGSLAGDPVYLQGYQFYSWGQKC